MERKNEQSKSAESKVGNPFEELVGQMTLEENIRAQMELILSGDIKTVLLSFGFTEDESRWIAAQMTQPAQRKKWIESFAGFFSSRFAHNVCSLMDKRGGTKDTRIGDLISEKDLEECSNEAMEETKRLFPLMIRHLLKKFSKISEQ